MMIDKCLRRCVVAAVNHARFLSSRLGTSRYIVVTVLTEKIRVADRADLMTGGERGLIMEGVEVEAETIRQ